MKEIFVDKYMKDKPKDYPRPPMTIYRDFSGRLVHPIIEIQFFASKILKILK